MLTGSFTQWGDSLINAVDLIVFLDTPTSVRIKRLDEGEAARHGERILPGGDMHEAHLAFRIGSQLCGLITILRQVKHLLNLDCVSVDGRTLGEIIDAAPEPWYQDVVRPFDDPVLAQGAIRVLRGNLAPGGAILKVSAASPALLRHEGRAVVFESIDDMAARIDAPDFDVTATDVLVLKGGGPVGAPGMPEAGYIPIPKKLAAQGVKDMVRLSDARMSGTAFGTVVLHITTESAVGGPFALIQTGDIIRLDADKGILEVLVSDEELARRAANWKAPEPIAARGYAKLYVEHVTQADQGCDFDFMKTVQKQAARPPLVEPWPFAPQC